MASLPAASSALWAEPTTDLEALRADVAAHYQPATPHEQLLVDEIACAHLRLQRVTRVESGLFSQALDEVLRFWDDNPDWIPGHIRHDDEEAAKLWPAPEYGLEQRRNFAIARGFREAARRPQNEFTLLLRYQG